MVYSKRGCKFRSPLSTAGEMSSVGYWKARNIASWYRRPTLRKDCWSRNRSITIRSVGRSVGWSVGQLFNAHTQDIFPWNVSYMYTRTCSAVDITGLSAVFQVSTNMFTFWSSCKCVWLNRLTWTNNTNQIESGFLSQPSFLHKQLQKNWKLKFNWQVDTLMTNKRDLV